MAFYDMLHQEVDITGTPFLSQSIAVIITAIATVLFRKWRRLALPWLVAAITTSAIIVFSFYTFHYGPRILTESDGPQTIGYDCDEGEQGMSILSLTGASIASYTDFSLTNNLCFIKNIPLAASNISPYHTDYSNDGLVLFAIYEAVICLSFLLPRRLLMINTKNSPCKEVVEVSVRR